jgi:hypothetical protein
MRWFSQALMRGLNVLWCRYLWTRVSSSASLFSTFDQEKKKKERKRREIKQEDYFEFGVWGLIKSIEGRKERKKERKSYLLQILNDSVFGNELLTLSLIVLLGRFQERLLKVLLINIKLGLVWVSGIQAKFDWKY